MPGLAEKDSLFMDRALPCLLLCIGAAQVPCCRLHGPAASPAALSLHDSVLACVAWMLPTVESLLRTAHSHSQQERCLSYQQSQRLSALDKGCTEEAC